jgi:hypothetical protein
LRDGQLDQSKVVIKVVPTARQYEANLGALRLASEVVARYRVNQTDGSVFTKRATSKVRTRRKRCQRRSLFLPIVCLIPALCKVDVAKLDPWCRIYRMQVRWILAELSDDCSEKSKVANKKNAGIVEQR